MTRRADGIYLSTAFFLAFLAIFVGPTRVLPAPLAGAAYAGLVLFVAGVVWRIGGTKTGRGYARQSSLFLPGALLLAGPLVLVLGASVTGHPTADRPGHFLFNTTALLVGVLVLLAGFALLSARLWRTGRRLLPALGIAGVLIGAALYAANMIFRYAVIASGAAEAFVVADLRVFPELGEISFPLQTEPSWLAFLYVWATLMLAAYGLLSYLAAAVYGAALLRAGWIGKIGGRVVVVLGLSLALVMGPGWLLLGNPVVEALIFFLGVPFMTVVLPYFLGVSLVRRAARGGRTPVQRQLREPAVVVGVGAGEAG